MSFWDFSTDAWEAVANVFKSPPPIQFDNRLLETEAFDALYRKYDISKTKDRRYEITPKTYTGNLHKNGFPWGKGKMILEVKDTWDKTSELVEVRDRGEWYFKAEKRITIPASRYNRYNTEKFDSDIRKHLRVYDYRFRDGHLRGRYKGMPLVFYEEKGDATDDAREAAGDYKIVLKIESTPDNTWAEVNYMNDWDGEDDDDWVVVKVNVDRPDDNQLINQYYPKRQSFGGLIHDAYFEVADRVLSNQG